MSNILPIDYIKFRWAHTCDVGGFLYQTGWFQEMYINAVPTKPKPTINREGLPDINGDEVFSLQRLDKMYNLHLYLREYQIDALAAASMHSQIQLFLGNGQEFTVRKLTLQEPAWDTHGGFAEVDIDFSLDSFIITNCCKNEVLNPEAMNACDGEVKTFSFNSPSSSVGTYDEVAIGLEFNHAANFAVDWGDGTVTSHSSQSGYSFYQHTFVSTGTPFTITIIVCSDYAPIARSAVANPNDPNQTTLLAYALF